MRKFALILVPFLLLGCDREPVAPDLSSSTTGTGSPLMAAQGPLMHHVSAGGPDVCSGVGLLPGCDANFSVMANAYADGSVTGQWQDSFGDGYGSVHITVDCLIVYGNFAVVGGVVSQFTPDPSLVGTRALMGMQDNGTTANDPPDRMTGSAFGFPSFVGCDYFPVANVMAALKDMQQGQVTVN